MDNGNGGSERAGPPSGGPVRSIRKNIVLPCSGPTDLHYGKNGYIPAPTIHFFLGRRMGARVTGELVS